MSRFQRRATRSLFVESSVSFEIIIADGFGMAVDNSDENYEKIIVMTCRLLLWTLRDDRSPSSKTSGCPFATLDIQLLEFDECDAE